MRSGLELRWSIPDPSSGASNPFPPFGNVRAFLEPDANSLHYHLPQRSNPFCSFLRAARYLVRKLIAPWLLLQTRFNLSTIRVLEQIEQRVRALEEAELALRQIMKTLEDLNWLTSETGAGLDRGRSSGIQRLPEEGSTITSSSRCISHSSKGRQERSA
jgi:hypothetical protein